MLRKYIIYREVTGDVPKAEVSSGCDVLFSSTSSEPVFLTFVNAQRYVQYLKHTK